MIDPLGTLVREARADAAVAALVGTRVAGGDFDPHWPADPRPCVVLVRSTPSRMPFGQRGSGRLGLQELLVIARCYGAPDAQGDPRVAQRTSAQLAGAVSDAFHNQGPRRDSAGRVLFRTDSITGGGPGTDPDTRWPYEVVMARVVAAAGEIAA